MSPHRIRTTAAALALAAILLLGAPAHAAGWESWTAPPDWIENALEWFARLWLEGSPSPGLQPARMKSEQGNGIDPNGTTATPTPPSATPNSEQGNGIDPNG
jgi:hypothetical protein